MRVERGLLGWATLVMAPSVAVVALFAAARPPEARLIAPVTPAFADPASGGPVYVEVKRDGQVLVAHKAVEQAELSDAVRFETARAVPGIVVRADAATSTERVTAVLNTLAASGYTRFQLISDGG